jgi:mannose-6-phosphate isomerase-like protein (cupin superfamily)
MTDINLSNLPPQEGFTVELPKLAGFRAHPDEDEVETDEGSLPQPSLMSRAFGSNDFHITYLEMEPGEGLPWHTHAPIMYQVYVILQGTFQVQFKDNDGEIHTSRTSADEEKLVYLPPGAHNRIESVGDEPLRMLSIKKETMLPRVEQLLEDDGGAYDPWSDPKYGLEIDTLRGRVLQKQDGAVEEY